MDLRAVLSFKSDTAAAGIQEHCSCFVSDWAHG
jgi:hypothetical protein